MATIAQVAEAGWDTLQKSILYYQGQPVGTVAACDAETDALNYDQCFTRDFAISAIAFLLRGEPEIVRNFLITALRLQSRDKQMDCFKPGQGLMPASFKVQTQAGNEVLDADFGEQAIARVAPIDSVFWWLILLRAYSKTTGDFSLAHREDFQRGIRLILDLCLIARFDMFPTLLVPDGSFMIDRRMGVYGYPLEIQVLFYAALRSAEELLCPGGENDDYITVAQKRISHITYHVRQYYWLDLPRLRKIYRYQAEEFGRTAVNQFNIYSEAIPDWIEGWIADNGGYFVGNLGPGRIDFRWFAQGNLFSIFTALADEPQSTAILNQLDHAWDSLVASMPLKACFPALEGRDWELMTGSDPKNTAWSYHNGGSWPFLLLPFVAACQHCDRIELGHQAMAIAAERLQIDHWPEYYDGKHGRLIGKEARTPQTWTIAGFVAAYELLVNPEKLAMLQFDPTVIMACDTELGELRPT